MVIPDPTALLNVQKSVPGKVWTPLSLGLAALLASFLFAMSSSPAYGQAIAFDQKQLVFGTGSISSGTSLQFGPDGLLYVSEVDGTLKIFTIVRDEATGDYQVTAAETVSLVQNIPNHNDDGSATSTNNREVTGLAVGGGAANVEWYVTSSDSRIGGPSGDLNLDTNSGVITRLTRNGIGGWDAVDIVRGLPRSEENHAPNGLELVTINGIRFLIVSIGGLTNAGSPSNNFAFITEYALSAAVIAVNLNMLESMPIVPDPDTGRSYIYDLPTLDDPTRPNVNGIVDPNDPSYDGVDVGDPWGGNDGLNMAMVVPGGPVQIFSPGYRNSYDLVATESGAVYVTDNGANGSWGGYPENEATANVNNDYRIGEPGSTGTDNPNAEPVVNNADHLNLVTTDISNYVFGSVYGGHPSPVRANVDAGLYTRGSHTSDPDDTDGDGQTDGYFRTVRFDPNGTGDAAVQGRALPANWPPVPASHIDVANADFRHPGANNPDSADPAFDPFNDPLDDITVTTWSTNTNGIDEYTASNFGGQLQGNLLAGNSSASLHRVELDSNGLLANATQNWVSGLGGNPLGITAQGDLDIFPGTIWIATFNSNIVVLEPNDFVVCLEPTDPGYDPQADNDFDGFTNQDEEDNGTDPCSGASQPEDFDGDKISNRNDLDDDGDGIDDAADPFQLGVPGDLPQNNELLSDQLDSEGNLFGYRGLGLTGLMNNGAANPNWLAWIDRPGLGTGPNDILGGAIGAVTIQQTGGTAAGSTNTQEKAFQYGINVGPGTGPFTVESRMFNFNDAGQLYAFTVDPGDGPPSQGIFIGTGHQDNYIEFVLTQDGLTFREEVNDATAEQFDDDLAVGERPQGSNADVVLFIQVEPTTGTVTGQYSIDGGPTVTIGTIAAEDALLNAIQQDGIPAAVGVIGTSGAPETSDPNDDKEFAANWDYLTVTGSAPFVSTPLPDLERLVDDPNDAIDLNSFFDDDSGTANLAYSVESNTDPTIAASVAGNILTIVHPSVAATTQITVRATDSDTFFVEQTFTVTVTEEPVPIVRINAGGGTVVASDGGPNWEANSTVGATSGPSYTVNTGNIFASNIPSSTGRDASIPANITDAEFDQLFANERWDPDDAPEMLWSIPLPDGNYEVRLYFGNGFTGTSQPSQRVYDVNIEGGALEIDGLDLSGTYGHQVGAMESYVVTVTGGDLTIEFLHDIENPLINAIEVLAAGGVSFPISVTPILDQFSIEGFPVAVSVDASGGDGTLSYLATGLPPGIVMNPNNGLMSGTVSAGAVAGSPYDVDVTVDDSDAETTDAVVVNFTWEVSAAPDPGTVLFRVNAGGPTVSGAGGNWGEDQAALDTAAGGTANAGAPSPYLDLTGGSADTTFGAAFTGINATSAPDSVFTTERFSEVVGTVDNLQYDFPVPSGDYTVNLYFAEIWDGAQNAGDRVFEVHLEGQPVLQNFDQTATYGWNNAGVQSFQVPVVDDNLDVDFIQVVQNPNIKAIEILQAAPPANPDAGATIAINPGTDIDSSTFNGGFSIANNSTNGLQISSVTFNLSSALFPEMVFDPLGTAGDSTAKCFEALNGVDVGLLTDGSGTGAASCADPFSNPRGNGGYDALTIDFDNFDPGESFEFAVDVDPTSIEGAGGSGAAGSVSGLELVGSTASVTFSDGTTVLTNETYRIQPGSNGGSANALLPAALTPPPGLALPGAILAASPPGAQNATVTTLSPTVQVSGPVGGNVSLLIVQAERTVPVADLFEANDAVGVSELDAVIGGGGTVDIPLTLSDAGDDELNYLAAVIVMPDGRTSNLSTVWRVDFDPLAGGTPMVLIQVNPGEGLEASTFGAGSFVITNIGDVDIESVMFDTQSGILPDVVFDPNGTAGDAAGKCLEADGGAAETGYIAPVDQCLDPYGSPHNGIDGDDGYETVTLNFDGFGAGEVFTFSTDMDPTSIKNDVTTGDAGSISGFELIGTSVTVTFTGGVSLTASLFDEFDPLILGGSMAVVEQGVGPTPSIALSGPATPVTVPDAEQTIVVTGTPGANVWLLQIDARLYIDAGGGGFDLDPFEANDAMAKVLANATIEGDGNIDIPVELLVTESGDTSPDGGLNHFIAVEDSSTGVKSLASNVIVVELDPNASPGSTLAGTILLQGRDAQSGDHSGDIQVTLHDALGAQVGDPIATTADANGQFTVTGITPGSYQVAVKPLYHLQVVETVDITAGTTTFDFGVAGTGDADNSNAINIFDFSILVSTFGLSEGQGGYNPAADFNGTDSINILDFSWLVSTFGDVGEMVTP